MSTEKLFDTSLYPSATPEVVAEDLAGLFIEAGDRPLEERINARKLKIIDGKVYDPKTGKEVPGNLKRFTVLDNLEANSAEMFYHQIAQGYSLALSFSPAEGISQYKEGRINVGFRNSEDEMEFYGIPTKLAPETIFQRSLLLSEFSDLSLEQIKNPDELRGISLPITLPAGENPPWNFLEEIFPLDSDAWNAIKQGGPWFIKEKALVDAEVVSPTVFRMIRNARSEWDFIAAGAYGERQMELMGWRLNGSSCPGKSNSDILGNSSSGKKFAIDSFGNTRELIESSFPCPRCHGPIPSGLGITVCPHCGLTKEEAGSTCG